MKIDLELFRTFKAVFEIGTISGAARVLEVTQPSVTGHLKAQEAYAGHPLFERSTRNMKPTLYAKQLYNKVASSLTQLEVAEDFLQRKCNQSRSVTLYVGIYPGLFRQLLVPNIKKLDCNVVMTLNDNETLGTLLENGNMDLVVTTKDIPNRNVQYELLGTSRFILVAGGCTDISELPDLNLLNKKKIEAWLQKQVWYNTVYGEHLSSFWKLNFGRTPRFTPNYVLPDKYSIVCCLRNGTGLAVLPESLCREFLLKGEIKEVWGGYTEMKNTLFLGQRKNTLYMNEIKELKKLLRTEFLKTHPTTQN